MESDVGFQLEAPDRETIAIIANNTPIETDSETCRAKTLSDRL
ncbi:hypothetical protein PF003_g39575 [Phytophthora fragariae]|nr:hypothetical protein PF003_g39575 [Phytophthora fragariae]